MCEKCEVQAHFVAGSALTIANMGISILENEHEGDFRTHEMRNAMTTLGLTLNDLFEEMDVDSIPARLKINLDERAGIKFLIALLSMYETKVDLPLKEAFVEQHRMVQGGVIIDDILGDILGDELDH